MRASIGKWLSTQPDDVLLKIGTSKHWTAGQFVGKRFSVNIDDGFKSIPGTGVREGCLIENAGLERDSSLYGNIWGQFDRMYNRFELRARRRMDFNESKRYAIGKLSMIVKSKALRLLREREGVAETQVAKPQEVSAAGRALRTMALIGAQAR